MEYWKSKTIYRKIILVILALQLLGFFVLPYATLYRSLSSMSRLFGGLADVDIPESLTGFSFLKLCMSDIGGDSGLVVIFQSLVLIMILGCLIMHVVGKGGGSYIGSLILELIIMGMQCMMMYVAGEMTGYEGSPFSVMVIVILNLAIVVVSIIGIAGERKAQARLAYGRAPVSGGAKINIDTDKLARNLSTAGRVAGRLARKGGEQLAKVPGAVKRAVSESKTENGAGGPGSASAYGQTAGNRVQRAAAPSGSRVTPAQPQATPVSPSMVPQTGFITGIHGEFAGAQFPMEAGETFLLGRSTQDCSIILTGEMISRRHCSVQYDGQTGNYLVKDFSANGTYTGNGGRLPAERLVALAPGTVLWLGDQNTSFQLG